jgi:hypothetical protein
VESELRAKKSNKRYIDYASDYGVGNKDYEISKIQQACGTADFARWFCHKKEGFEAV